MKAYDIILVININAGEEGFKAIETKLEDLLDKNEGKLIASEDLGILPIYNGFKKQKKGKFIQATFTGTNTTLEKLNYNLRITESLMRFTIVKADSVYSQAELTELLEPAKA